MAKIKSSDLPFVWGSALFDKNLDLLYADESLYSIFDIKDDENIKNLIKDIFVKHTDNDESLKPLDSFSARGNLSLCKA